MRFIDSVARTLLRLGSLVACLSMFPAGPASAGSILYNSGPPVNCNNDMPRVCFSGAPGFPLAWGIGTPVGGAFTLATASNIDAIEVWGAAGDFSIWSTTQNCPFVTCTPRPDQQVATLSVDHAVATFYAIGEPQSGGLVFNNVVSTLASPLFLDSGTYYLRAEHAVWLPSFSNYVWLINPTFGDQIAIPGVALAIHGTPVPEPATILLVAAGLVLALGRP